MVGNTADRGAYWRWRRGRLSGYASLIGGARIFLLEEAEEAGIYKSVDYGSTPVEYCSMTLSDNPLHSR